MTARRRTLPLPVSWVSAFLLVGVLAMLLAGCGSTTQAASSGDVRLVCHTQSLTVEVGSTLFISGCPAGTAAASGSSGLAIGETTAGGLSFVASATGVFTVSLDRHPVCTPGTPCPSYIVIVAVLRVHVTS